MDNLKKTALQIGVIGAGTCSKDIMSTAYDVGKHIARHGAILVCGGQGGVMEGAAKGARDAGGTTVGILPGIEHNDANPYIDIKIVTGLSHARNILVVRSSMALVAVAGSYGTLSEIAIALKLGIPVIGLKTWDLGNEITSARDPHDAVSKAVKLINKGA